MNSEELEQSLRTEFEDYLKIVLADMRREISDFQGKIEAEFEKHRSQLDEVFHEFSARLANERELDAGFKETVVEHLRIARDEGATLAAKAFADAEDLDRQNAVEQAVAETESIQKVGLGLLRNATTDISKQTSQATVLTALVEHAERFAPRGAFFIVKNNEFVGWRVFGQEANEASEEAVRNISLPVESDSILGEAVRSLSAVESSAETFADDSAFLKTLDFGEPSRTFALPLVARGRGVAVLYADGGAEDKKVNVEALETLLCVAGLTVEVLAATPAVQYAPETQAVAAEPAHEAFEQNGVGQSESQFETQDSEVQESEVQESEIQEPQVQEFDAQEFENQEFQAQEDDLSEFQEPVSEFQEPVNDYKIVSETEQFETVEEYRAEEFDAEEFDAEEIQAVEVQPEEAQPEEREFVISDSPTAFEATEFTDELSSEEMPREFDENDSSIPEIEVEGSKEAEIVEPEPAVEVEYEFEKNGSADFQEFSAEDFSKLGYSTEESAAKPEFDASSFITDKDFSPADIGSFEAPQAEAVKVEAFAPAPVVETVAEAVAEVKPPRSRLSERNVDLPIEVSEDERRLHNDARRFARLLVSEIKLYNEQKVKEGREAKDLYDRLREAIDRSREMYDKRVQPPVAAKFDYFHYELVSSLAEGEEVKLGNAYPGANV